MFGAYKYRDQIAIQDCGKLTAFATTVSTSAVYTTGGSVASAASGFSGAAISTFQTIGSTNNFHKLIYRVYMPLWGWTGSGSAWGMPPINLYLASLNSSYWSLVGNSLASSVTSIGSNWGIIDSANLTVNVQSTSTGANSFQGSVSQTVVLALDVRPEKFSANYGPAITPILAFSGTGLSETVNVAVTCDAYGTDFQPAALFDAGLDVVNSSGVSIRSTGKVAVFETDYL